MHWGIIKKWIFFFFMCSLWSKNPRDRTDPTIFHPLCQCFDLQWVNAKENLMTHQKCSCLVSWAAGRDLSGPALRLSDIFLMVPCNKNPCWPSWGHNPGSSTAPARCAQTAPAQCPSFHHPWNQLLWVILHSCSPPSHKDSVYVNLSLIIS